MSSALDCTGLPLKIDLDAAQCMSCSNILPLSLLCLQSLVRSAVKQNGCEMRIQQVLLYYAIRLLRRRTMWCKAVFYYTPRCTFFVQHFHLVRILMRRRPHVSVALIASEDGCEAREAFLLLCTARTFYMFGTILGKTSRYVVQPSILNEHDRSGDLVSAILVTGRVISTFLAQDDCLWHDARVCMSTRGIVAVQ